MTNEEHIEQLKKLRSFHNGSYGRSINKAIEALNQQKVGHWIDCEDLGDDGIEYWCECSECHSERAYKTNFCPDCGAKMKSEG